MENKKKNKNGKILSFLEDPKKLGILIPIMAILLSLVACGILILCLGKNPLEAYTNLLQGSGFLPKKSYPAHKNMLTDLASFMNAWTPMLFASLAVSVAMKTGLFNIGVSGQMLIAGFITSISIGYSDLNPFLAKPLVIVVGALVGALAGGLIGWCKYKFNINEVVSSIMLNYIFQYVISFFINTRFINPVSRQSDPVSRESRLTFMEQVVGDMKIDIPLGIILAVIVAFIIHFLLNRTVTGYEMKAVGANRTAAKYAGISIGKNMILSMIISGGLAGLAGVTYYMGYFGSIQPNVLTTVGFDAIAVALLANNNAIGVIFSSLLVTIVSKGSTYMSSSTGLESEIALVITGFMLLFSACVFYMRHKVELAVENAREKERESDRITVADVNSKGGTK